MNKKVPGKAVAKEIRRKTRKELFIIGLLEYISSDNRKDFTSQLIRKQLCRMEVPPLFTEPGSPWINGYNEPYTYKLKAKLPNGEILYTLRGPRIIFKRQKMHYNNKLAHTHSAYKLQHRKHYNFQKQSWYTETEF